MKTIAEVKAYLKKEITELEQEIKREQYVKEELTNKRDIFNSERNLRDWANQILTLQRLLVRIED